MNAKFIERYDKVPVMTRRGTYVPYEAYSDEEICHIPDSGDAKLVLMKISFFDSLTKQGCFASNDAIADSVGLTCSAVANICARMKRKGFLYTLGFMRSGIAFRRVRLNFSLEPNVSGVRIQVTANGAWRWRQEGEPNPRILSKMPAPALQLGPSG